MPRQLPTPAHGVVDFFSRALSSFQQSNSKFQVICTAAPSRHCLGSHHVEPALFPPTKAPRTIVVLDSSFNPPTRAHLSMATSALLDLSHKHDQDLSAMRLLLLLSVNNADKGVKPAAFDKRLAMMWAFAGDILSSVGIQGNSSTSEASTTHEAREGKEGLSVDIGLTTVPYFHEKSAALDADRYYRGGNDSKGAEHPDQVFLVGYDTLIRIFNPKYYNPPSSAASVTRTGPESTPMRDALDPFFRRAWLRVTPRLGDEWGGSHEQSQYLQNLLHGDGLEKVGGVKDWGKRIELVEGRSVGGHIISSTHARAAAKSRDLDKLDAMVTPGVRWWIEQEDLYQ
jgi:nicotinamide-nucleotide adenylyltransferase